MMVKIINQKMAQQIVDTVKDVCGTDINFIDENGKIYASTDSSRVGTFHEIGKQVVITGETIEVTAADRYYGTHPGVNIPISHDGHIVAVIGISGVPDEVRKYGYLAQRITKLILKEYDLNLQMNSRRHKTNYIIRSLADGEKISQSIYDEFINEYKINRNDSYQVVVLRLDARYHPGNITMIEQDIYQTFDQSGSALYTFSYPNEYLLLLGSTAMKKCAYLFEQLASKYGKLLRIGIGDSWSFKDLEKSYKEADIALKSKRSTASLSYYSALDLELLWGNIEENNKQAYIEKISGSLTEEEKQLLIIYYEADMSLAKTSQQLFLHKNTIQYQLDRIYKKTSYNPRTFKDAVVLYTALKL